MLPDDEAAVRATVYGDAEPVSKNVSIVEAGKTD
jgi:hypothetical protein